MEKKTILFLLSAFLLSISVSATAAEAKPKNRDAKVKKKTNLPAPGESMDFTVGEKEEAQVPEPVEETPPSSSNWSSAAPAQPVQDNEEAVNLDELEEAPPPAPSGHPGGSPGEDAGASHVKFKLFFDFVVRYILPVADKTLYTIKPNHLEFTKDHTYVMLAMDIAEWLTFRTDISPSPEFFEMTFRLGQKVELTFGKILVPFGQNEWHHLIGGRVDFSNNFLPTIWTDYGISLKHRLYDGDVVGLDYSIYIVNGFGQTDDANLTNFYPAVVNKGFLFPTRKTQGINDNNSAKGIGFRPVMRLGKFAFGGSLYFDTWDDAGEQRLLTYGGDINLGYGFLPLGFLRNFQIRAEIAWTEIDLPMAQNYYRGILAYGAKQAGSNLEFSFRFTPWLTVRYREGRINPDSRFLDTGDRRVHEPAVIFRAGPVSFQLALQILSPLITTEQIQEVNQETKAQLRFDDHTNLTLRVFLRY